MGTIMKRHSLDEITQDGARDISPMSNVRKLLATGGLLLGLSLALAPAAEIHEAVKGPRRAAGQTTAGCGIVGWSTAATRGEPRRCTGRLRGTPPTSSNCSSPAARTAEYRDGKRFDAPHWAANRNAPDLATLLLDHKAQVDARTNKGYSPLHWAAISDAAAVARVLISAAPTSTRRPPTG